MQLRARCKLDLDLDTLTQSDNSGLASSTHAPYDTHPITDGKRCAPVPASM